MSYFHSLQVLGTPLQQVAIARVDAHATLEDPAQRLMTDLDSSACVCVPADASLGDAERLMQYAGVRMAFVVDGGIVSGNVTLADLRGERTLRITGSRHVPYEELVVRDVMTSLVDWTSIHLGDVWTATIGDIVATMRDNGARYLFVLSGKAGSDSVPRVRGIFSASRIEKALGAPISVELRSRSFADLAVALAHV